MDCKHLSFEERVVIQTRLKDGYSIRAIARELGCSPSTISYEVRRGTVSLYHGKQKRYKAGLSNKLAPLWPQIRFLEEGWLYQLCH